MSQVKKCTTVPPNFRLDTETFTPSINAKEERPILLRVDSKMEISDHSEADLNISRGRSTIIAQHDTEVSSTSMYQLNFPKQDSDIEMLEISEMSRLSLLLSPDTPTPTGFAISLSVLIAARPNLAGKAAKHPQKAFRAAFKTFSEQRLGELEKDSNF